MQYDSGVIEEFAGRLLKRARTAPITHALMGAFFCGMLGLGFGTGNSETATDASGMGFAIGAVVGIVAGAYFGKQRAFQLRLQAQNSLVQVQMEKHLSMLARVAAGRSKIAA